MNFQLLMTEPEANSLAIAARAIPRNLHGLPLLEIGAGVGGSTAILARGLRDAGNPAQLTSVDNCTMDRGRVHKLTNGATSDQADAIRRSTFGLFNVRLVRADSVDMLPRFAGESFALVLIDGDHRYEAALRDFCGWSERVATKGGLLVAHDIGKSVTTWGMGPTQAFAEWFASATGWRHVLQVGSLVIVQRTGA